MFQPPGKNDTLIAEMLHSLMRYRVNNILLVATDGPGYRQGLKWIEYVKPQISLHVIHREIPTPGVLASREIRETMSAKKFEVIKDLMVCNIHVLLSDFDVIFWDNPFRHLIGDADLEGMTDGWEYETQYGWHVNTWKGGPWWADRWFAPWEWRVVFLNSGFFYIRASNKTAQTMAATWQMLTLENIWDQAAFNAQIRAPLGTPKDCRLHGQGLSIRIMDPYKFSNSRVFNTIIDKSENAKSHFNPTLKYPVPRFHWPTPSGKPVAVHVNYHWFKVAVLAWARKVFDNVHRNGSAVPRNGTAQRNSIVNNKRAAVPRNGTAQRNSSVNHKRAAVPRNGTAQRNSSVNHKRAAR